MPKLNESKQLIERITALEQFVSLLKDVHNAADYHKNKVVELSIINAESAISEAVKALAQYNSGQTNKSLNVAWFYAKFAQDILAAEATEHILGQGDYLDLIEDQKQIYQGFQQTIDRLEKRLSSYESELLDATEEADEIETNEPGRQP